MKSINQLRVSLELEGLKMNVGELVADGRSIYFKYYPDFIEKGLQLSPFKLPLDSGILSPDTTIFDGLFGVFSDSLPDGWGRLLLDRALMERGIALQEVSALDRLAFIGRNGRGALCYEPSINETTDVDHSLELDTIAKETQKVLQGFSTEIIEELLRLGGSSGGARPKILIGYHPQKDHIIYGQVELPEGYEHWLIKFSASADASDMAEIEYAYYQMALAAGISMSSCRLFQGASGKLYFGTRRFDRIGNKRLHLHSAAGLMHDNFRLSTIDYGHLMDAAFRLENKVEAYDKILRLAAFNVFSHNRDDHSKNISFLMNAQGEWQVAPAYDLTFSMSSHGFHSTTIAGEGKAPNSEHLLGLAKLFNIKKPQQIIDQVKVAIHAWNNYAKASGVSNASLSRIQKIINF